MKTTSARENCFLVRQMQRWGTAGLLLVCILIPAAAQSAEIEFYMPLQADEISSLNPSSSNFDLVYEAGPVQSVDGMTTFGNRMCIVTRSAIGSFNYFDCVVVLAQGNVYYKMVRNFTAGTMRGTILGGDGAFQGITGTITETPGFGLRYMVSFSMP
jgi:hypothetical protein